MLASLSRFFVYSNLFIAVCAVLMADETMRLLVLQRNNYLLYFIFFSTLTSYGFHWYLSVESVVVSSRNEWLKRRRQVHLILFIIGLIGSAIFFFYLLPYWHWMLLSAAITFLYSAPKIPHPLFQLLRRVALGKTIFLAFVWMYVTTILPILCSETPWQEHFNFFIVSRFCLIYAICILFDYRDREDDKKAGIRSLITYLSDKSITILFTLSLITFAVTTLMLLNIAPHKFDVPTVILLLIPGIITAALYNHARKNFGDMLYYFVLDGLMALSSVLTLLRP